MVNTPTVETPVGLLRSEMDQRVGQVRARGESPGIQRFPILVGRGFALGVEQAAGPHDRPGQAAVAHELLHARVVLIRGAAHPQEHGHHDQPVEPGLVSGRLEGDAGSADAHQARDALLRHRLDDVARTA